jgi:hypothetical protein
VFDRETHAALDCWRYSSWDDAVAGHAAAVRRLGTNAGITPDR